MNDAKLRTPVDDSDHVQGPLDAPLTLVEYGDFECPYCGEAYPIIKRIQKELGGDLRFVFRHFPLTSLHPHALPAAKAAEAAGLQDAFWPMHDLLFEDQDRLDPASLVERAASLDLDLIRFKKELASPEIERRVVRDLYGGTRSGVQSVPSFFINGHPYNGNWAHTPLLAELVARLRRKAG